jgi:hypothetical protein
MKKFLAGLVLTVILLSGCATTAPAPEESPENVVNTGMSKLSELTSYKYELDLNTDMNDPENGKLKFNIKLSGALDIKDTKDPRMDLKINGSVDAGADAKGSIDAQVMLNKTAVYAKLAKLDLEGQQMPQEFSSMFGKWWSIDIPEGALNELELALPQGSDEELTPEQRQMKQAFLEANIFSAPEYVGSDNVMGEASHKYAVTVNKDGLVAFVTKTAEIQGQTMSSEEIAEFRSALEKAVINGHIWVGSESGVINQFDGIIQVAGGADEASGTIKIRAAIGDINKPVNLNIPKDATPFPTEMLFGMMMMGAMSNSSFSADGDFEADFDYSMFDDFDDYEM